MKIRIADIVQESFVDGPGIRFTIFAQGCSHKCKGCQNPKTHDYNAGRLVEVSDIIQLIESDPLIDGVSFSGGEPFDQALSFWELACKIKEKGLSIIVWSGYTYEQILQRPDMYQLLSVIDYLVDGEFQIDKRSLNLKWKGSYNQRLIDVQRSLEEARVVELEDIN